MLKNYPKFRRNEVETIYKKLSSSEKKFIEDYLFYRRANGLNTEGKVKDLRRSIIQIRHIIEVPFKEFDTLEKLNKLSVIIKESYLKPNTINPILVDLRNLFMYTFDDWSSRFKGLKCFSYKNKDADKLKNTIPDEDFENILKTEKGTFYKTFLLYENATGLRIKEARETENDKIKFNDDGTATIQIFMTKTSKPKIVFTDPQTTDYIKKLQEEQKNSGNYGKYLFHSPQFKDRPISKNAVDNWFRKLSFRATGKYYILYSLRHKKATKLYNLSKENKISEFTALRLLGHAKNMMSSYDHTPLEDEIKILKEQAFRTEISTERKHELEIEIDNLKKMMFKQQQQINKLLKNR